MLNWLTLSHHHHSGRLRPHEHTSYLPLGILLLIVGIALTAYTATAISHPGPDASSVGLSGTMPAKPPTVAATITTPGNQQRFSTSPVTVGGLCPATTLVEIFKNNIFAGATPCTDSGKFSLDVDLLIGQNTIVARVYDALNQPGPDSNQLIVFYDALPPQAGSITSLDFGSPQMLLNTDAVFRGAFPNQQLSVPVSIVGGTAPYAINIRWGDSLNNMMPRSDNATFNATHAYDKPGTYQISLQATDAGGRVAFLTVASIINGQPPLATTAAMSGTTTPGSLLANLQAGKLLVLWPLYSSVLAVVASFWVGEHREHYLLTKRSPTRN